MNKIVDYVLRNVLGKYVENFNSEQISLAYFSGHVTLNNLILKRTAIRDLLGLPFLLKEGNIGFLSLQIPYTNLNQPWSFVIKDLNATVELDEDWQVDETYFTSSYAEMRENQLQSLQNLETRWQEVMMKEDSRVAEVWSKSVDDNSWWSSLVSFAYSVIRNLTIKVNNVRIIYVSKSLKIDLEIASLVAEAAPLDSHLSTSQYSKKIFELDGFKLYTEQIELISTTGKLAGNVIRRLSSDPVSNLSDLARFELQLCLNQLVISLPDHVLQQFGHSSTQLVRFMELKNRKLSRPESHFSKCPCHLWWKYAAISTVRSLLGPTPWLIRRNNSLSQLLEEAKLSVKYVHSYTDHLISSITNLQPDKELKIRLDCLEKDFSLERIKSLRQIAMQRAAKTIADQKSDSRPKAKSANPWGVWWLFSSLSTQQQPEACTPESKSKEDEEFCELLMDLSTANDDLSDILTQDKVFLRLSACISHCSFHIYCADRRLMSLQGTELVLGFESRPRYNSLKLVSGLKSFTVTDACNNSDCLFREIVSSSCERQVEELIDAPSPFKMGQLPTDHGGLFWIEYQLKPVLTDAQYLLHIRASALQLIVQPFLLLNLEEFLQNVTINHQREHASSHFEDIRANLNAALDRTQKVSKKRELRWAVNLDIATPKILFPDRFTLNSSTNELLDRSSVNCVLYDFGCLKLGNHKQQVDESDSEAEEFLDALETFSSVPSQSTFERIYETYELCLTNFRVVVGNFGTLCHNKFWQQQEPAIDRRRTLSMEEQRFTNLYLVDQSSCVIHLSRRLFSREYLPKSCILNPTKHGLPIDLPNLVVVLHQPRCCLHFSERKLLVMKNCLQFPTKANNSDQINCDTNAVSGGGKAICKKSPETSDRRRVVASFRLDELITQLEFDGRTIAEFNLTRVSIGLTSSNSGNLQAKLVLHSLTLVDTVMAGRGGEYDLLAASHKAVHLDALSGKLKVSRTDSAVMAKRKISLQEMKFSDPIEFQSSESDSLIRINYVNRQIDEKIDFKFNHLDLVVNPITFTEIYQFFQTISVKPGRPDLIDFQGKPQKIANRPAKRNNCDVKVSLERLSLVLIDIEQQLAVKTLLMATMSNASVDLITFENKQTIQIDLNGLQILDLTLPTGNPRYQLATENSNSLLSVQIERHLSLEGTYVPVLIKGFLNQLTYIHSSNALKELSSWLSKLPSRMQESATRSLLSAANQMVSNVVENSDIDKKKLNSNEQLLLKISIELKSPLLVLPESNAEADRFFIFRLGDVHVASEESNPSTLSLLLEQAQLSSLDFSQLADYHKLRCNRQDKFKFMLDHFRRQTRDGREFIIEDLCVSLLISRVSCRTISQEPLVQFPDYFHSPHFDWPSTDDDEPNRGTKWLVANAKIEKLVSIKLKKKVFDQLISSLSNLVEESQPVNLVSISQDAFLDSNENSPQVNVPVGKLNLGLNFEFNELQINLYEQEKQFCRIAFSDFNMRVTKLDMEQLVQLRLGSLSFTGFDPHCDMLYSICDGQQESKQLVTLQFLLVEDSHAGKFEGVQNFLHVTFNQMTCRLNVRSWLSIFRFLTLNTPARPLTESINFTPPPAAVSNDAEKISRIWIYVSSISVFFTLEHADLAFGTATGFSLQLDNNLNERQVMSASLGAINVSTDNHFCFFINYSISPAFFTIHSQKILETKTFIWSDRNRNEGDSCSGFGIGTEKYLKRWVQASFPAS
ncbi:hypothetical protein Ciccas_002897 [Cichlidogyrus casuarinus]|uniref:Chorein N-terminal domain-containing protein n=1 Tax=Cichlidogyrus casuarinus TaxID=1844966 RepID=A0ABD2QFZ3_9PLAT